MKEISKRILQAISDSKLSYAELEEKTGIAKSSIQRYATANTKKIPVDAVKLIANATNCSAAWIMGWKANSESEKINDAISDIIVALRKDSELLEIVESITKLDADKRTAIKSILGVF